MREIKFRAWDKRRSWMLYDGESCGYVDIEKHEVDVVNLILSEGYKKNLTFLQYTGLVDKNGREIYEGDILPYRYVVTFVDASNSANLGMPIGWYEQRDDFESFRQLEVGDELEVLGNIYEHSHLLEDNQ